MMLLAYLLFSVVDTSVKWLLSFGFPALQLAFLRYAGQFVITVGLALKDAGGSVPLRRDRRWLVLLRGASLVVATVGNFTALTFLPLTIVSAIMFTAPIIVCLLSVRVLDEEVGPWRWGAILLGFVGVLVVIQPFGADFHWAAPLCLVNATLMAIYSLMTRALVRDVGTATLQFYGGLTGTVMLAPVAFWVWQPAATLGHWLAWAALGLAAWAGHELLTRAHRIAPANTLMPFSYSFLIYMALADMLIFAQFPGAREWTGIGIIVIAGLIIWKRGERAGR